MKLKACPFLLQRDTTPSLTIAGESYTRSFFLRCLGGEYAGFVQGPDGKAECKRLESCVSLPGEDEYPKCEMDAVPGSGTEERKERNETIF